jgi:D-tyrosyl-tRNA(Tyr) deacylase
MRAVIQRVSSAKVTVLGDGEDRDVAAIANGLLVLIGVEQGDELRDAEFLAQKICQLRLFDAPGDGSRAWSRSVADIDGELLVVSQFTLLADCRQGRRPSFSAAAAPEGARRLYEAFIDAARQTPVRVSAGEFRATMRVSLANEGPVTLLIDSRRAL